MRDREELLLRIIHHLAERFRTRIALEGGMFLRLMGGPRSTQDVDFVLLSRDSKKVLAPRLRKLLGEIEGVRILSVKMNSRGIFIDVESTDARPIRASVEIGVQASLRLPAESASTSALAGAHALGGRMVTTIALAEGFTNKIAAALERNNLRDLYDLMQFESMGRYDAGSLQQRLDHLSIGRGRPRAVSFSEAATLLRERAAKMSEARLEQELYPLIPSEEQRGLLRRIQIALGRIASQLEAAEA